jgi:exonuclease III
MQISTWNIQHGGGKRIKLILDSIAKINSDIFVFTEFRNNQNKNSLINGLQKLNYNFFYFPQKTQSQNTVLIASKINLEPTYYNSELTNNSHRVIKVTTPQFEIYGCYFPQKNEKSKIFDFLLKQINKSNDKSVILIGDFNTGKHYIDEESNTFYCSEYINKIEQQLVDGFRFINKDKKEYSWYSKKNNGFRIDHCFLSKDIKINNCYYDHQPRINKISDHSILTINIQIN